MELKFFAKQTTKSKEVILDYEMNSQHLEYMQFSYNSDK